MKEYKQQDLFSKPTIEVSEEIIDGSLTKGVTFIEINRIAPLLDKALSQSEPNNEVIGKPKKVTLKEIAEHIEKQELPDTVMSPVDFNNVIHGKTIIGGYDVNSSTYHISTENSHKEFIFLQVLGEPTAQKRHRSVRMGGFTRQYDPSSADKADFLSIVQQYAPETPYNVPLRLDLVFHFTRPKSHYRTGSKSHLLKDNVSEWHTARPDTDNCIKFVMDALNKIYWRDDSVICSVSILKRYSTNPRTEITITPL